MVYTDLIRTLPRLFSKSSFDQWPVLQPRYNRSYDRNPKKLDHSAQKYKNSCDQNDLAYLDYDRSYDSNALIVLSTAQILQGIRASWRRVGIS